jgi:hypothetical protein
VHRERVWRIEIRGIHPHGDRKSAEVIERKADTRGPLSKRVRKSLKANGLNERDAKNDDARGRGLGIRSGLELGKHGRE